MIFQHGHEAQFGMIIAIKNGTNFVDCYLLGRLCTIWSGYIFQYPLQFYSSVSKFSKLYNFSFTAEKDQIVSHDAFFQKHQAISQS